MTVQSSAAATAPAGGRATWAWAIRRAVLGIFILTVGVGVAASLLYFAIDRDAEARAETDQGMRKAAIVRGAGN